MAQVTEQSPDAGEITLGERLAGWAGIFCGLIITAVCIDMASGGRLSGALSGALSRRDAAAVGLEPDAPCPGGCP